MGNIIILPAGVDNRCTTKSADFLCVGVYPEKEDYGANTGIPDKYKK
jgi:uncharacterized protein YjlB